MDMIASCSSVSLKSAAARLSKNNAAAKSKTPATQNTYLKRVTFRRIHRLRSSAAWLGKIQAITIGRKSRVKTVENAIANVFVKASGSKRRSEERRGGEEGRSRWVRD